MSLQAKYTEQERAVALAFYDACGNNLREAARKANVPHPTLYRWVNGGATNESVVQKRTDIKEDLADKLERIAHELADAIPGKIERAGLQASAVSLGVAIDKMRLLREQATQITDDASLSDDELDRRIAAAEARKTTAAGGAGEVIQPAPPDAETV